MSTWFDRSQNILGMNARNLEFVRPYNNSRAIKTANHKLLTKQKLVAAGLPTAKLYGVIEDRQQLFKFDWSILPPSIVVKPNFGLGGGGILVLYGKDKQQRWIGTDDSVYSIADLTGHISNILDGNYSLSNIPDIAYFEERLSLTEDFKNISYQGIPDIRVIVFNSVPVMAMLRLPTKQSQGKANLHIGGIGVGIDLFSGTTTYAVSRELGELTLHPDFNTSLSGVKIPHWEDILRIAIDSTRAVGLGYAGVDIVLDKKTGPVVLEVNGHPGLEIQNANHQTLRDRLERVAGLTIPDTERGLIMSRQLFGRHTDPAVQTSILGVFENVTLYHRDQTTEKLRALIDTGLASTTITKTLAAKLGFKDALAALTSLALPEEVAADRAQAVEDAFRAKITALHPAWVDVAAVRAEGQYIIRPKLSLTFTLGGKTLTSKVAVALNDKLSYPLIIGRKDLAGFLINPTRGIL